MRILVIPHNSWRTPQRARFFALALAREHEVHVTNWDADFQSVSDVVSRRYLMNHVPRKWHDQGLTVHHVPRISPALRSRGLRRVNQALYERRVAQISGSEGIDVVVGTFVCGPAGGSAKVLDVFDDNVAYWHSYGGHADYARDIAANERAWAQASRAVVTASTVLRDMVVEARMAPRDRVLVIPNGVDLDRFKPAEHAIACRELGLDPALHYVGNIGSVDKRNEVVRLLSVARTLRPMKQVRLLIAGGGSMMPMLRQAAQEEGLQNVVFLGFLSGDALLRSFQALTVGLCPYAATRGAHASCPMRLLHYSAVGATVVCARLEEASRMNFSNVVFTEDDDRHFAQSVLQALDRQPHVPGPMPLYDLKRLSSMYGGVLHG